ncbi:protein of unknown function [Shewanella benthica]|uniref:Uncharacterized protein n=1 Tax=Shewanella benthica TaxID=43661 RepID=A0A330M4E3_9GAMM|nr:protein of unknown function [Shewanella benthica]
MADRLSHFLAVPTWLYFQPYPFSLLHSYVSAAYQTPILYSESRSHFNLNKRLNFLDHSLILSKAHNRTGTWQFFLLKKQYLHNVMFVFDICRAYTCCGSEEPQTLPFREYFISHLISCF